jgi:hypothetical protein
MDYGRLATVGPDEVNGAVMVSDQHDTCWCLIDMCVPAALAGALHPSSHQWCA